MYIYGKRERVFLHTEMSSLAVQATTPDRTRNSSYNFLTIAQQEARDGIEKDVADLLESCPPEKKEEFTNYLHGFQNLFGRFIEEQGREIKWSDVEPPPEEMICRYDDLVEPNIGLTEMINKLVSIYFCIH